jgi:hypothetical protein
MTRPCLFHTDVALHLFQATQKTRLRFFHNSIVRPVRPPHTAGGGLRPLHASVVAAWPCPSGTNAGALHLQHENTRMQHTFETNEIFETYAYNMCVKHMQHLDKTLAT